MDKSIEILSAHINSKRQLLTRSVLSIATYEEYVMILSILIENAHHDYPDIEGCDLLSDLSEIIKKIAVIEDCNTC